MGSMSSWPGINRVKFSRKAREIHAVVEKLFTATGYLRPQAHVADPPFHRGAFVIDFCVRLPNTDQPYG
jgi:hypothetical protein